nr:hypothetical protein [Tanacetum cinerariifolium]
PWKGDVCFRKREKLNLRYIGPFKILARVGPIAYMLELPEELKGIHSTFHVSNRKKCLVECDVVISLDEIQLDDKLHMIEELVEVVDRERDGSEFRDTADSGKRKETKAFTFYHMETEESIKNMISNEFAIKLLLDYKEKDGEKVVKNELLVPLIGELYYVKFIINPKQDNVEPGVVLGWSFLRLAKGIVDFGNKIKTIYPDLDSFNDDSDIDWDAILESVDVSDLPQLDVTDIPTFVFNMGKSLRNKNRPSGNYKMKYDEEGNSLTIKIPVVLDKLKLDREVELEEEATTEEVIRGYKDRREKNDLRVFVLPIWLEAKFEFHTLANTSLNINVMPYQIYEKLDREEVKPVNHEIKMLNYSKAEPMGILKDVLYQVGVTMILAKLLILDMPKDRDVIVVMGRSFLFTCGAADRRVSAVNVDILMLLGFEQENVYMCVNTLRCRRLVWLVKPQGSLDPCNGGNCITIDQMSLRRFFIIYIAKVKKAQGESNNDGEEGYCVKRDETGKPIYGLNFAKYLNCDDPMNNALALLEALNPFRKICVWKKAVAFLGLLPGPLQHVEWIPNYSANFSKNVTGMGNGT